METPEGKKLLGKNVVATNHIDYRHMEPYDGGCIWTAVLCTNVGGSLPVSLQNQGAAEMAQHPETTIHFVMNGKVPK